MSIVFLYCIFADADEAERIGRILVEERLAACINILAPCRSIYRWQGRVEDGHEVPAILKTAADRCDHLIARLSQLHSYDVPAITAWPAEQVLPAYAQWVEDSTSRPT